MLLFVVLTTMTAWADGVASLTKDGSEYYVNMPQSGTNTLTITASDIAAGKTTFKVYDDGGKSNNYTKTANGDLIISAPEDYIIRVSGTVAKDNSADFILYEGTTTDNYLYYVSGSYTSGTTIDLTTSLSSQMRIHFRGGTYFAYAGVDLTVNIIATRQSLLVDNSISAGEVGHYYTQMPEKVEDTFNKTTLNLSGDVKTFKIYDDGGKGGSVSESGVAGNYSDHYYKGYIQLKAPTGYIIQLTGNICTSKTQDKLTVYDGTTTGGAKLLDGKYGNQNNWVDIGTIVSSENTVLLYFETGYNKYTRAGLDLTAELIDASNKYNVTVTNADNGSVAKDKNKAEANETVTLTATPANGYMLNDIEVTDANSNAVAVSGDLWQAGEQTLTFTMPASAVTVTPTFLAPSNLYVKMPVSGTISRTIPASVTSVKVYDDGGSTGTYTPHANGYLLLTAPENYFLRVSGHVAKRNWDILRVYDGNTTSSAQLLNDEKTTDGNIATVTTTGRHMLIKFYSNYDNVSAGLDLTVMLVNGNEARAITVETVTGGSVTANPTSSTAYQQVELTISPNANYLLQKIDITDANNNVIGTSGGEWYTNSNVATFTMPASAVTVTPTFTNKWTATDDGLYIKMPVSGNTIATIPSNVQSFKVKYNHHISSSGSSTLKMTAPEGYLLQLSGTATMEGNDKVFFYVYDGDGGSASPKLINSTSSVNNTSVVSSGNVMTIYCYTTYNWGKDWNLDMTVTLVPTNATNNVTISNSIVNGQVINDKATAKANETVTLTVTPNEGYVLQSISVTDNNGAISLTPAATNATFGDVNYYTATQFTFKMRSSDATVNATFMLKTDFYVNMPKTGQRDFTIPDGTTSFNVYDNSGKDGYYFTHDDGKLLLTAPKGYVMKVTGYVKLYGWSSLADYLDIFDGNSTSSEKLGQFWNSKSNDTKTRISVNVTSSSNQLFLHFVSDGSGYVDNSGGVYLTVMVCPDINLADKASNATVIAENDGRESRVTLADRKLYKDGNWNTLCLPFDVDVTSAPLAGNGVVAKVLDAENSNLDDDGKLTLKFNSASVIPAGTPFIIKWTSGSNISNPVFNNVTINANAASSVTFTDNSASFVGTFSPFDITTENRGYILLLTSGGKLGYSKVDRTLGSCRAYFETAAPDAAREFIMNFGDDENTTGIIELSNAQRSTSNAQYYDLQGRKVTNPTKGLYLVNGKKVVIK